VTDDIVDPIRGISHITFVVKDLDRMARLLCDGLGAREVYDSGERTFSLSREKFFVLGGTWLAAMQGEPPSERSYQHIAFEVATEALPVYRAKLEDLGVGSWRTWGSRSVLRGRGWKAKANRCTSTTLTTTSSSCMPVRWRSG